MCAHPIIAVDDDQHLLNYWKSAEYKSPGKVREWFERRTKRNTGKQRETRRNRLRETRRNEKKQIVRNTKKHGEMRRTKLRETRRNTSKTRSIKKKGDARNEISEQYDETRNEEADSLDETRNSEQ